jgi:hypothetical protein
MMRWRSEPLMDSLGVWTGAWDALNDRHFDSHPMLSSRFVNGLLRNFPAPGVRICIGESDGEVRALCLVRRSRLGVWSSYLPSQAQISPSLFTHGSHHGVIGEHQDGRPGHRMAPRKAISASINPLPLMSAVNTTGASRVRVPAENDWPRAPRPGCTPHPARESWQAHDRRRRPRWQGTLRRRNDPGPFQSSCSQRYPSRRLRAAD